MLDEGRDRRAPSSSDQRPLADGYSPGAVALAHKEGQVENGTNGTRPAVANVPWYRTKWGVTAIVIAIVIIVGGIVGGVVGGTHHSHKNNPGSLSGSAIPSGSGSGAGSSASTGHPSGSSGGNENGVPQSTSAAGQAPNNPQQQSPVPPTSRASPSSTPPGQ